MNFHSDQLLNDYDNLQIEKGTATTYEAYKGKDYEINLGKNLLNNSISSQTLNEVTLTANSDGSVTCNGTASATIILNLLSSNLTLQAGTYTLSGCPSGGSVSSKYKLDIYKSSASSFLTYDSGSGATFTLTEETTFDRVRLVIFSGYTATDLTFYPMLEKSSTATDYAPYFTPIELNKIGTYQDFIRKGTGKNICNNADIEAGYPSGGIGSQISITTSANSMTYKKCCYVEKSKTYTLSWKRNTPKVEGSRDIKIVDDNNIILESIAYSNASSIRAKTFTPNNSGYIYVAVDTNATEVQIEENSSATYYEPYGYKDKWYIEKQTSKYVFDGSSDEDWKLNSSGTYYKYQWNRALADKYNVVNSPLYCNYFSQITVAQGDTKNIIGIANGLSMSYSIQMVCEETSLDNFKTWLSTNKPVVYYQLANPTYTLIENEELTEQLARIMQLYEGQNNILVTGDLAATLDLDYIVKAENHL